MFSIVSSLEIFMWIQLLCNYIIIMQLQSYVHSHKQYIIHCMQRHFVAVSSCNSGVWIKSGLWGQSSLAGLAHSDEAAEAWRAGTDAAVMLFIERSGDVFWYLFSHFFAAFTSRSLRWRANCQEGRYWIQALANVFSEPWPVTKVIANEDIYGGMHRLLTQEGDRKRLRERTRLMYLVHYFQEWQMLLAWHSHFQEQHPTFLKPVMII